MEEDGRGRAGEVIWELHKVEGRAAAQKIAMISFRLENDHFHIGAILFTRN